MGYAIWTIVLTEDQRKYLKEYTAKGVKPVHAVKRAHILLEADGAKDRNPVTERDIAEKVGVSLPILLVRE